MPKQFQVSFARYTPESIEAGDHAGCGMLTDAPVCLRTALEYAGCEATSRQSHSCTEPSDSDTSQARWITYYWGADWETGESLETSIHFPGHTTPASRARLCRLLGAR